MQMGFNLKDPKSNQPRKGSCNFTRCIEDTQASRQLVPLIKCCQVEYHTGIESRFCHPKEPSRGHNASEVDRSGTDHGHGAEHHHSDRQNEFGSKLLGEHVHRNSCQDQRYVKDGEEDIVLVSLEMEIYCQSVCFGISEVRLVNGAASLCQ